jgi:membrane-bound ClpP family serine protease
MKDKIISLAITAMLMLAGWNLHETYIMSKQIVQIQAQVIELKQMVKKTNNFVKNKLKKQQKKNKKNKKKKKKDKD